MANESYCRDVEAYLCQKNRGHLVRVVGPAFQMVLGWAEQGVPLTIVQRGIDRYLERLAARGPRRRPVRIEFCEADVLEAFDQWRRAVGIGTAGDAGHGGEAGSGEASDVPAGKPGQSLRAHLDRVCTRLTDLVSRDDLPPQVATVTERLLASLGEMREPSRTARGETRQALVAALEPLDRELVDAAVTATDAATLDALRAEAGRELEAFRMRMPADAWPRAMDAATRRLVRERYRLPLVTYGQD